MSKKLDSLSKIIIATGQINYMAASIDSVNEQAKMLPITDGCFINSIKERDNVLAGAVKSLTAIMEKLGNLINSHDCISQIDQRVAAVPFEILVHGMDDCENSYEDAG